MGERTIKKKLDGDLLRRVEPKVSNKVERFLDREARIARQDLLLVAVSGGSDSVALLHLLVRLRGRRPIRLHVVHVDHGLRESSREDAAFVEQLARCWDVPFLLHRIPPGAIARCRGGSLQQAARELRYRAFTEAAEKVGARWVVTAHTRDDQAETFLLRLIRGSGTLGLAAIPPVRDRFLRPLLDVGREQLRRYLREEGIPWRDDPSNRSSRFLRNRVRDELIPLLEKYNPGIRASLARAARLLRDDEVALEGWTGDWVRKFLPPPGASGTADEIGFPFAALEALSPALARRAIRAGLTHVAGDLRRITGRHIDAALNLLRSPGGRRIELPLGIRIVTESGRLIIRRGMQRLRDQGPELPIPIPIGGEIHLPRFGLVVRTRELTGPVEPKASNKVEPKASNKVEPAGGPYDAAFDLDRLPAGLAIRSRHPGERFYPLGMAGRRKKVSDLLIDRKIARSGRDRIPLLVAGEEVVWVVGLRLDGRFVAGPHTRRALRVWMEREE